MAMKMSRAAPIITCNGYPIIPWGDMIIGTYAIAPAVSKNFPNNSNSINKQMIRNMPTTVSGKFK